jgi:hypothetical protein
VMSSAVMAMVISLNVCAAQSAHHEGWCERSASMTLPVSANPGP